MCTKAFLFFLMLLNVRGTTVFSAGGSQSLMLAWHVSKRA